MVSRAGHTLMEWHLLPHQPGDSACLLHTAQEEGLAGFGGGSLRSQTSREKLKSLVSAHTGESFVNPILPHAVNVYSHSDQRKALPFP